MTRWRLQWSRLAAVVAVAVAVFVIAILLASRSRPPQRIVLIVIDTLRRDVLSCYGSAVATPNIAALARRGQVFTNAVSSYHQTSMSMAALFTGRTPSIASGTPDRPLAWGSTSWCGLSRFAPAHGQARCVPSGVPTLAEALDAAGYWTVGVVSNALLFRPYGYDRGFREWIELRKGTGAGWQLRQGSAVNRAVIQWLEANRKKRFFLYVHYMDAHDWWIRESGRVGIPAPVDSETARLSYEKAVRAVDSAVGELVGALDEHGVLADAMIVLVADHGEGLGEVHALPTTPTHWGNPSFEAVLQVPLIVSPDWRGDAARLVRTEDVFRLIKKVAGLPDETERDLDQEELFLTELNYRTYRKGRWKSVWRRPSTAPLDPWRVYVDGLAPFEAYFRDHDPQKPVLFDLEHDPAERQDVADAHPAVIAAHKKRIDELSRKLAARPARHEELSPVDRERLRALGYLD